MDANIILGVSGIIGALIYMYVKYMDKLKEDPSLKFDYTYAISTLVAAIAVFMSYEEYIGTLTIFAAVGAFLTGLAYSAGAATINSKIPLELKSKR